jgi:hypothetical protein
VDDRNCTTPIEVQEEDRLQLLHQHSTLSPYSLNANFWRAPLLASNHLCSSPRCLAQFIAPVGRWLQEGVLVGERKLQCPARRCVCISRCGRPYDFHRLRSCICDLFPKAVRRQLWVCLLREGGVVRPLGVVGPRPSCHSLRIMLLCVDEVLDVAPRQFVIGLWIHGSK